MAALYTSQKIQNKKIKYPSGLGLTTWSKPGAVFPVPFVQEKFAFTFYLSISTTVSWLFFLYIIGRYQGRVLLCTIMPWNLVVYETTLTDQNLLRNRGSFVMNPAQPTRCRLKVTRGRYCCSTYTTYTPSPINVSYEPGTAAQLMGLFCCALHKTSAAVDYPAQHTRPEAESESEFIRSYIMRAFYIMLKRVSPGQVGCANTQPTRPHKVLSL